MKFKLWITIQKIGVIDKWSISYIVHNAKIYNSILFVAGYPVDTYVEDNKVYSSQNFVFNKNLHKVIKELLLPGSRKNYISVTKEQAWNYYHFCSHEKFTFAVHPISIGNNYFRMEFEGTQEEILNKCKDMNDKWTKNFKY